MLTVNLFDPAVREDPFPTYARMRSESPVSIVEPGGFYTLSRYADVSEALRDTQTYSSEGFRAALGPEWAAPNPVVKWLLFMDPPKHGKYRRLVSKAFVPAVLAALERVMEARVDELLSTPAALAGEPIDLVGDLAMPFVGTVIAEALGLEHELVPRFAVWVNNITRITPVPPPPEVIAEVRALLDEEIEHLSAVIHDRQKNPCGDLPSELCTAEIDGERLDFDDQLGFMMQLLGGGFETTIHLLSKSAMLLAERPELHAALREDPERVPAFVEEMLRYDGPSHLLVRLTTRDVEIHGVTIPAHRPIALMLGAANRDPEQFEQPDRFDLDRQGRGAIAFGHGPHICIAAALARIEGRVCLRELTRRFSKIELERGPRDWVDALYIRGLHHLPGRLRV